MRLSVICCLLWTGLVLAACQTKTPQIWLEIEEIDLGEVVNGDIIHRQVTVRNEGQSILAVESVSSSCGCTQATLEPMRLEPEQEAVLTISFDSGAHGPDLTGPLMRQIFITSNDPVKTEVKVNLVANIVARAADAE